MFRWVGLWFWPLWAQFASVDSVYGLLDLRLEMPQSAFSPSTLIPKGTFQRKTWYRWAVDTSWMGVPISQVQLAFYRQKLHTIELKTATDQDSEALLVILQTLFGTGKQEGYAPRYRWQGQKATLLYDQNLLTRSATIRLESLVLQRQLEADVYRDYNRR